MKKDFYYVPVDKYGNWTDTEYRRVSREELDKLEEKYGRAVLKICSNGNIGAMAMWACFKNVIDGGCYGDMINAYRLLADDHNSLVDREHELRHAWNHYEELVRIRHYGTVENYYLERAKKAKERYEKYCNVDDEN